MKNILAAIMIPAICLTLAADSTGRITAKVTTKAGAPIPGAKILLERDRSEMTWAKAMITGNDGKAMQVGLVPKDYDITVSATGFGTLKFRRKIPLGETLNETFVLLTDAEAQNEARATSGQAPVDAAAAKESESSAAYNSGVTFYNEQKFAEALPFIEQAHKTLLEAVANMKDATTKAELEARIPMLDRVYGITLVEVGKSEDGTVDEAKAAMLVKAEPFLVRSLERAPKDQRLVTSLLIVANGKQDEVMIKKYQDLLDALIGPRPELAYNDAVAAFNAGNYKKAKVSVTKAIATDPKFADSYWLSGVVEFSLGNTKGAKEAFKKYMEIAPTGKKSGEVKEFLKELK